MSMMASNLNLRKEDVSLTLYIQDIYSGARYTVSPLIYFQKLEFTRTGTVRKSIHIVVLLIVL